MTHIDKVTISNQPVDVTSEVGVNTDKENIQIFSSEESEKAEKEIREEIEELERTLREKEEEYNRIVETREKKEYTYGDRVNVLMSKSKAYKALQNTSAACTTLGLMTFVLGGVAASPAALVGGIMFAVGMVGVGACALLTKTVDDEEASEYYQKDEVNRLSSEINDLKLRISELKKELNNIIA